MEVGQKDHSDIPTDSITIELGFVDGLAGMTLCKVHSCCRHFAKHNGRRPDGPICKSRALGLTTFDRLSARVLRAEAAL